ncbi:MAG: hypothetical protein Q4F54_05305 [Coriobacteriia bacterium]|nr:hypothetical protein [Coriobacteriia bacterium]
MFKGDTKIPSFDAEKVDISMAKSETLGGYFTIKNVLLKARFLDGSLDFFVNNELTGGTIYNVPLRSQAAQDVP